MLAAINYANGYMAEEGVTLYFSPVFVEIEYQARKSTWISFRVFSRPTKDEEGDYMEEED